MHETLPTVVQMEALRNRLFDYSHVRQAFPWTEEDRKLITLLLYTVTNNVEEVALRGDGSIWAKPGCYKDGSREPVAGLLGGLNDKTHENKSVRDGDLYRMGINPFQFLEKVAKDGGCRTHTAQRLDTARVLGVSSVDDFSYAFYFSVRWSIFASSPHDDRKEYNPTHLLSFTLPGLILPEIDGADHPNRKGYAILRRYLVIKRILERDPTATIESIHEAERSALVKQTNAFWWLGFEAEHALVAKLRNNGMFAVSAVLPPPSC